MGYLDSENFVDSDSAIFICILDRDAWKYFNHFVSLMIEKYFDMILMTKKPKGINMENVRITSLSLAEI